MPFSDLMGETLVSVEGAQVGSDEVLFTTASGKRYRMRHYQDCCEHVRVEDVVGDVQDLVGSPITMADESTNNDVHNGKPDYIDSHTWTFYKLATVKGYVDIRWLGESNGYYSEAVDFDEVQ